MQTELPIWISILQALATPVIAIAGCAIAYSQLRLGRDRFQYDLYDRRMKVFEGLKVLLVTCMREASISFSEIQQFVRTTSEAEFLFDADVVDYLEDVRKKAHRLNFTARQLAEHNVVENRGNLAQENADIMIWINDQLAVSVSKFKPYMAYGRIRSPLTSWLCDA